MKVTLGQIRKIIREELRASRKRRINEATWSAGATPGAPKWSWAEFKSAYPKPASDLARWIKVDGPDYDMDLTELQAGTLTADDLSVVDGRMGLDPDGVVDVNGEKMVLTFIDSTGDLALGWSGRRGWTTIDFG